VCAIILLHFLRRKERAAAYDCRERVEIKVTSLARRTGGVSVGMRTLPRLGERML
jgi:hypothetical protein